MDERKPRYEPLILSLASPVLTPKEIPLTNVHQIIFARLQWRTPAGPSQKLAQDFIQVSFDDNNVYLPMRPGDKIAVPPGSLPFSKMKYRILRGVNADALFILANDLCTFGIGPREEIAQLTKNLTDGQLWTARLSDVMLAIPAATEEVVLTFTQATNATIFLYHWNIFQDPATAQNFVINLNWGGIVLEVYLCKATSAAWIGNFTMNYPSPLELRHEGIGNRSLEISVRNLGAAAANFGGFMTYGVQNTYANWNIHKETEGQNV